MAKSEYTIKDGKLVETIEHDLTVVKTATVEFLNQSAQTIMWWRWGRNKHIVSRGLSYPGETSLSAFQVLNMFGKTSEAEYAFNDLLRGSKQMLAQETT